MGVEFVAGETAVLREEGSSGTYYSTSKDWGECNFIVAMMSKYSGTLDQITYAGVNFTSQASPSATSLGSSLRTLVKPASGSNTLSCSWNPATGIMVIVFCGYKGVNTSDPVRVVESASNNGQSSISDTITGGKGDLLITGTAHRGANDNTAPTNGVTERYEMQSEPGGSRLAAIGDKAATGGLDTVGWTYNAADNNTIVTISVKSAVFGDQVLMFLSKIQNFYDSLRSGIIPPNEIQRRYREVYNGLAI